MRDLKLVYDLQLDREISARREYQLTVESQLRRELASELRAQAADEVAALRAELAALRTNLEILFEAELDQRPALETDRATVRGYCEWANNSDNMPADWVPSNRVTSVRPETSSNPAEGTSIIDVPEEPVPRQPAADASEAYHGAEDYRSAEAAQLAEAYIGSHWRSAEDGGRSAQDQFESEPARSARHQQGAPAPPLEPRLQYPDVSPQPQQEAQEGGWYPPPGESQQPSGPAAEWQPVSAEGQSVPAGEPGSNRASTDNDNFADAEIPDNSAGPVSQPSSEAPPGPRRGRHVSAAETAAASSGEAEAGGRYGEPDQRAEARDSAEYPGDSDGETEPSPPPEAVSEQPTPRSTPSTPPEPAARHRSAKTASDEQSPQTGGQSVAELLARFQAEPIGGGRRRRRED
jgi:hypothetical protein